MTVSDAHIAGASFHHCSEAPVHSGQPSNDGNASPVLKRHPNPTLSTYRIIVPVSQ